MRDYRISVARIFWRILRKLVFASLLTFFNDQVLADNFYVRPSGGSYGLENGNSYATAWDGFSSIRWGVAGGVRGGDTLYICGQHREGFVVQASGTSGNHITISGDCPGDIGILNGENTVPVRGPGLLHGRSKSYITVSNLRILNSSSFGIKFEADCNFINIRNTEIGYSGDGGLVFENDDSLHASNVIIDGCDVHHSDTRGAGSLSWHEQIALVGTDTFKIFNTRSHHCAVREGIDAKYGATNGEIYDNEVYQNFRVGIYVDGGTRIRIYRNNVHDQTGPQEGHGIMVGTEVISQINTNQIDIYNNLIYNNAYAGLGFYVEAGKSTENVRIYNNTVVNNSQGGVVYFTPDARLNAIIRNNIFWDNHKSLGKRDFRSLAGSSIYNLQTIENNMFKSDTAADTRGVAAVVTTDAKFVSETGSDYHLRGDSPARDTGTPIGSPSKDYDGNNRPLGPSHDIGAYEYVLPDQNPPNPPSDIRLM